MDSDDKRCVSRLYVDLKEHFERLWKERKENITLQFQANSDRLDAAAKVLEHRLEVLNHAHEQALEDRVEFLRGGEFKNFKREFEKWQTEVNAAITIFNTRYEFRVTAATWISILSFVVAVFAVVLRFFKG